MRDVYLDNLPMASSDYLIPTIGVLYLVMVKFTMDFMRDRAPLTGIVKPIIILYNFIQIIANAYILSFALSKTGFVTETFSNLYGFKEQRPEYTAFLVKLAWIWCMLKISDFADTFFFVVQKKFGHVSFLHVYHHYTTMMVAYFFFKYIRTEQATVYAGVNCIVHMVMYFYYFLTSIGVKPSFKKLVTRLQLFQFGSLLFFSLILLFHQTKPIYLGFSIFSVAQCIMYIVLFLNFYYKAYRKRTV